MLHTVRSFRGMVVSPHHLASQTGLDVLKDGGDAIEAAVAVAACLAVVYPHMTGIGGDGFWLIAEPDGRTRTIDASGRSASRANLGLYENLAEIPRRGPLAANTMAGAVSGWAAALEASPRRLLSPSRLLRDAIQYAEHGVALTRDGAQIAANKSPELKNLPGAYASIFERAGRPMVEGERFRQPALAASLRRLASEGLGTFYNGPLATMIASDLEALGSPLTAADFADHLVDRPEPLSVEISGARLFNTAPPTQGLASLLILALFDRIHADKPESFAHLHGLVEATKQAFLVRDTHVGDPAWMKLNPQALLDDSDALDKMAARIESHRALPWPQSPSAGDTTWFGVIDNEGRTVSAIQSTYFEFGSGLVLPRSGIVWQNRGSSFRLSRGGWNALEPRRKPFHTLTPGLARFQDGRVMTYGTMGGEGQPQTQGAIFSRYARFGMPLQQAITAPRWLLGRAWGDASTSLKLEDRFDPGLYEALREAGHEVELVGPFTSQMGHAGAIVRHPDGLLEGACDPRSDGCVAAW
ncbi:gamma-glutamyltranspeptidase/glutathione hydrolase [Bradyrhizobium sp. CIR48]|uniref:gamma-glutamyltransferase family protein n=1 Tax=unclassified Bradyrhizobium TaxID=2631580 RepID=UPI001605C2C2|nr:MULTISPECIES: gamma-glutamyltransferase family protein [unclassified Bradyrhizobium]MBB4429587.1 gamma-glutamyltranspeptidase/glutathione hydrolase [Bradyrhizobium sp. CIR48]